MCFRKNDFGTSRVFCIEQDAFGAYRSADDAEKKQDAAIRADFTAEKKPKRLC